MIALNINVPQGDIDTMTAMFARYADHFKQNIPKTVEKTMVKIVVALRASTIYSKKVRRIVRNPNKYNASEKSTNKFLRAHEHIQDYYKNHPSARKTGNRQSWLPPVRDLDRKARPAKLAIEIFTQRRGMKYAQLFGVDKVGEAKTVAELMYPKQYNISRRGLARSSWAWMLKQLGKTSTAEQAEIGGAVSVSRDAINTGGMENYTIDASNKLNYIRKATKENISSALNRASKMMLDEIEGHKKGAAAKAGRVAA